MKHAKGIIASFFVAVITAASIVPALPVAAQSASLSIVPKKNYVIDPGSSIKDTLVIRNLDAEAELNLSLRVVDFTYTDDSGTPRLMLAEDAPETTWSLKRYLELPSTVTIAPKSSQTVDLSVAIPQEQGAGSYYSAIVYSSGASDGGNVGLNASGVTLVFTSIPGEVDELLTLEKFGAYHLAAGDKPAGYRFITTTQPENIAYTLKNDGNVTQSPVGSITLRHMFGQEIVITEVNPNSSLALIGQTRTFVSCIKQKSEEVDFNGSRSEATTCTNAGLWPGRYSANLELYYGQNGNLTQEVVGKASFWYLPVWFIVLLLIVLAIITFFIWRLVTFIKRKVNGVPSKRSGRIKKKSFGKR